MVVPARDDGVREPRHIGRGKLWSIVSWLTGLAILAGLVMFVAHLGELSTLLSLARTAEPRWLALALALQFTTYVWAAAVWYGPLRRGGTPAPMRLLVPLSLTKLFMDQALPTGGISGSLVVVERLVRRHVPESVAMAALLVGLMGYYSAYALVVIAATAVLYARGLVNPLILVLVAALLVLAFAIPWLVWRLRSLRERSLPAWVMAIPGVLRLLHAVADMPGAIVADPLLVGAAVLLQLAIFVTDAATLWATLHAIGVVADLAGAFVAFVSASTVATLSPIPLGLGAFEASSVGMLSVFGVPVEAALAGTLLLRCLTVWLPMLPGIWFVHASRGDRS